MPPTELTLRECARLLAIVRDEQRHTQALIRMLPRSHVGLHYTLEDIATDLANIVETLAGTCDCGWCLNCKAKTVCAACGRCARCSTHFDGCRGCTKG